ncbi:MAG: ferrous iron transporter B [Alphaproteobacteria bacterium]|nr:ferrous iron transporter B [Alphaproteobacteria bacterium]
MRVNHESPSNGSPRPDYPDQAARLDDSGQSTLPPLRIALFGAPNCGKSALFNRLTGAKQKVANFAGVTIERKEGKFVTPKGRLVNVIDLPGAYSLQAMGPDEAIARNLCLGRLRGVAKPDVIVMVVDATNLRLHLRLALELLGELAAHRDEHDRQLVIMALNQTDAAKKRGIKIDREGLERALAIPVIETVAVRKNGEQELVNFLENSAADTQNLHQNALAASPLPDGLPSPNRPSNSAKNPQFLHQRVNEILAAHVYMPRPTAKLDDQMDRIFLHPFFGLVILFAIMFMVFQAVFTGAAPLMDGIKAGFTLLSQYLESLMPAGLLRDFLSQAVIGGSGAVLVFIPQIVILFFFILVLEESGYLPRAAFLLDRIMRQSGLSGRSFIPLLSSFACAIPGIMATRTIHDFRDRLVTIMIAPLMTCSARLPVYALLIGAFIPERTVWGWVSFQGLVLFILYLAGIFSGLLVAKIMSGLRKDQRERPFMMEIPAYHWPNAKNLLLGLYERAMIFAKRISGVIFAVNSLLWFLVSFPSGFLTASDDMPAINHSFAGMIGHVLAPIFAPIGFNWQIVVALIPGLAAREVAVSALGTVYAVQVSGGDAPIQALSNIIARDWSMATALSLLAWYVFAPQCLATLAVIRRETNSIFYAVTAAVYLFALAYAASFVTYRLSLLFL